MAIPVWVDGPPPLSAADVNNWFVPLVVCKTATESVTSSVALQNDDHLVLAVAANAKYEYECLLRYDGLSSGGGAGGIRADFTVPASATITRNCLSYKNDISAVIMYDGTLFGGSFGAGTTCFGTIKGILTTVGTAGNLQLQWAQYGSSGTATRVFADSYLRAQRVG